MTVEKPVPKYLHRPLTTGANSPINQSEFVTITCNLLKGREKSRVHWLRTRCEIFNHKASKSCDYFQQSFEKCSVHFIFGLTSRFVPRTQDTYLPNSVQKAYQTS